MNYEKDDIRVIITSVVLILFDVIKRFNFIDANMENRSLGPLLSCLIFNWNNKETNFVANLHNSSIVICELLQSAHP